MILTPTRHLHHVEGPLRGVVKSLHEHGHAPISLLWTDNVRADQKFVERVIPSLRVDVDHTVADGGRKYPLLEVPTDLKIRVASSARLIDQVCTSILSDISDVPSSTKIFVGFAMEWDWRASEAGHFPASLMQIAVGNFVHLLQIYHICTPRQVPASLKALLFSEQVVKVGHHTQGNLDILSLLWELKPPSKSVDGKNGWIDLGIFARSKGLVPHASLSFQRLTEEVLGRTFPSVEDMRCSNWCQEELSEDQKMYAIRNVWLSLHMFKAIVGRPPAGARLTQIGRPGDQVTLRNGEVTVAHGEFVEKMLKWPVYEKDLSRGYINVSGSKRVMVRITKVVAPSFICHHHGLSLGELGPAPFTIVADLPSLVSREIELDDPVGTSDLAPPTSDDRDNLEEDFFSDFEAADSASDSGSDSDSDSESVQREPSSTHSSQPAEDQSDEEFEKYMDPDIDAFIATHQDGPVPPTSDSHPHVQPAQATAPRPTRTFQDILHEMQRLTKHIPREHSLAKQFSRWLRDAIFIPDKLDKARVEAVLKKKGETWDRAVRSKPDWVWLRVRRYVPPPEVLEPILDTLFKTHANVRCSRKKIKLFNAECHKAAKLMIEDVQKGWVSDPPGVALYNRLQTDDKGLDIWHCIRGTNSLEGSVHNPVRSRFGSRGASVELTVSLLSDFCYRKNVENGSRHRDGVEFKGHYDPWIEDDIDIAYKSLPFDTPHYARPGYMNVSLFKPTDETFIISELPEVTRNAAVSSATIANQNRRAVLEVPTKASSNSKSSPQLRFINMNSTGTFSNPSPAPEQPRNPTTIHVADISHYYTYAADYHISLDDDEGPEDKRVRCVCGSWEGWYPVQWARKLSRKEKKQEKTAKHGLEPWSCKVMEEKINRRPRDITPAPIKWE
ncbi:hypothetical protein DFH07DRAFT_778607 [Mycena maculata]|uniref:3'-5' exonuclease domain-containing protein n=1 Tax=Mycena maculata TaxID=230809 RepID=A0AAD7MZE3_9AGAR|nr:hypothetical protein DFH07DRAFT_778607 [Mycena maculata]